MPLENDHFNRILKDLNLLFSKDEIKGSELDSFLSELETDEVKNYIKHIASGSKPEVALRETFFNENSPFEKDLFPDFSITPELSIKRVGFIDYTLEKRGVKIILELKSLFEAHFKDNVLDKIKQKPINWQEHKQQIIDSFDEKPTETLITKIMLGVFANVPALDINVGNSLSIHTLNKNTLKKILKFYNDHEPDFRHYENHPTYTLDFAGQDTNTKYTKAKLIDMYGFIDGQKRSKRKK